MCSNVLNYQKMWPLDIYLYIKYMFLSILFCSFLGRLIPNCFCSHTCKSTTRRVQFQASQAAVDLSFTVLKFIYFVSYYYFFLTKCFYWVNFLLCCYVLAGSVVSFFIVKSSMLCYYSIQLSLHYCISKIKKQ